MTWAEFTGAAPEMAEDATRLFRRDGIDRALLATVRGEEPPRINPIYVGIVDGRLYAFLLRSAKLTDIEHDGRFALHTHQDPVAPSEFSVRGRARLVDTEAVRLAVAATWAFDVDETSRLVEFSIDSAAMGRRDGPEGGPPRSQSWRAGTATT